MRHLDLDGFTRFVQAVRGHEPFPWQRRLAGRLLDGDGWPALLDLPTGTGKTSVLDIAVYALAASRGEARLPRRMAFVVDRRVIVDQTAAYAARLAEVLADPNRSHGADDSPVLVGAVAAGLLEHGGDQDWPLHHAVLRGGVPRDGSWTWRPDQATILVSTVDQVGSRLLFDGYGVNDRMAPVHAGLLGLDTLFFLDEVHLSRPFADTLRSVCDVPADVPGVHPLTVVELSATPGEDRLPPHARFQLNDDDRDPDRAPELVRRLTARRTARLADVRGADPADALAKATVEVIEELDGDTHAVVVNRVASARAVHEAVAAALPDATVLLVTGRMRPLDRDEVLRQHLDRLRAGRDRPGSGAEPRPRIVLVATQTIEAGADLDVDGLVTEVAPIDSLRQRFGRLDRLGRAATSGVTPRAIILAPLAALKDEDPVYGRAAADTRTWLKQRFGADEFDVSPLGDLPSDPGPELLAPSRQAPLLLPHHVALLSQTSPRPATAPPVHLWLHGDQDPDHDVSVVWRADILSPTAPAADPDWQRAMDRNRGSLELAPPAPGEAMAVGIGAFREFARSRGADRVVRWGHGDSLDLVELDGGDARHRLRPGDTVVVPAEWGGVGAGTWDPEARAPVTDLGTVAGASLRGRVVLRLVPGATPSDLAGIDGLRPEDEDVRDRVRAWVNREDVTAWLTAHGIDLPPMAKLEIRWLTAGDGPPDPVVAWWRSVPTDRRGPDPLRGLDGFDPGFDGSDTINSFTAAAVTLAEHGAGVGQVAAEFARRAGLPPALQEDLELAGRLHDLGKADPRFQRMLVGGWPGSWVPGQPALAKSAFGEPGTPEARQARQRSGYPTGARHEVSSVALVQASEDLRARAHDWDLVLHLVASHHGSCRPFAPLVVDPRPDTPVEAEVDGTNVSARAGHGLEMAGSGITDRFWRLQARYGPWGLAYLETVLRLADHRRSAWEREVRS